MGNKIRAQHSKYISIDEVTPGLEQKVTTDFWFHTGSFTWRIRFNTPLDPNTVNNKNLYVTNEAGLPVRAQIHYSSATNEIEIEPLDTYASNQSYILHISTKVQSKGGKRLREPVEVKFHL